MFGEITWFYPSEASDEVDRMVTYNYLDSTTKQPIWTTGTLARTAWQDSAVFNKPHATYYGSNDDASFDVTGNTQGSTIYYSQETGTDEVNAGNIAVAIPAFILSGDFDITQRRSNTGQVVGTPDLRGDGEYMMRVSRFIPDFITQTGSTTVSLISRAYPNSTPTTKDFVIDSSKTFQSTRIRARSVALKISNTATNQDWKLGTFRIDYQQDGRR